MNLYTDEMTEAKSSATLPPETPLKRAASSSPATPKRRRAMTAILLVATASALGLGLWILSGRLAPQITAPPSAESAYVASFPEKSIAVLPFEDLSETHQNVLLAEAVQDDILTALSRVADLRVISRTSVTSYSPDEPRNLREI